ncbi:MAG TPA: carboxypeptidase regulatory-like domain-containing protein [Bryocella sp.]|nr:carboxypeptidase regulatory-like domain-containing protein [Bryocella sp.]
MRFFKCRTALLSLPLMFLLSCVAAFGQIVPTATLEGAVTDPSGANIPSANVAIVNTGTGVTKQMSTDSQGRFGFKFLLPGSYELKVSAAGFAPYHQTGITLDVNVPATVNVKLGLESAVSQVAVTADSEMVDTESGTLRQLVGKQYLENLPLNGRNAATLVTMAPGVVTSPGEYNDSYANSGNEVAYAVNGAYGDQVSYNLDGAPHEDLISNLNATFPNPDALAEFSVQTNNFDARFGGVGGAVVNIVTKSGTNAIHGSLFEYVRNGDFNAINYFATKQDALKRNQFGGVIGGPIMKDRLFYFASFQGTTINNVSQGNSAFVPTAVERKGDFSALCTAKFDANGVCNNTAQQLNNPITNQPFQNNMIPSTMFNPLSVAMLPDIPTSSTDNPSAGSDQLIYSLPSITRNYEGLGKLDYTLGRHQLMFSAFFVNYTSAGWNGNGTLLNYGLNQNQTTNEGKLSDTFTIGPRLVNSFVADMLVLNSLQTTAAPFSVFDFGATNVAEPVAKFRETGITVTGFSGWGTGRSSPPGKWYQEAIEASDLLSLTHGGHTLTFGAEYDPYLRFDSATGYQEEPLYSFTGFATVYKPSKGTASSGNGFADFLLGDVQKFQQTAGKAKFTRGHQFAAFVQDEWRVNRRFTLDAGLRWEPFFPYTDPVKGQIGGYVAGAHSTRFPLAPTGLLFAGDPGFPSGGMYNNLGNFSPRVGLAYALRTGSHPTELRGGAGMFYIRPFMVLWNNFVQNAPFSPSAVLNGVNFSDPYGSAGQQNPFPPFAPVVTSPSTTFVTPLTYQSFNPHWHLGYVQSMNITLEHQLGSHLVARAAYVGDRGVNLQDNNEQNPAIYGTGATVSNTDQRRALYPSFSSLIVMNNAGWTHYNALQLTLEKKLDHGYSFVMNFTHSKATDNQSTDQQLSLTNPDPFNPNFNNGIASEDVPNAFFMSGVGHLPSPANSSRLVHAVAGGWIVSGIFTWANGQPFSITSGQDNSRSGVNLDRADLVPGANPYIPFQPTRQLELSQYFNTAAFKQNAPGTFGNSPRDFLRNPNYLNFDAGVQRVFPIWREATFRFRVEAFNAINTPHFSQPGTNQSSASTFGKITSAGDPRILQLSGRIQF